MVETLKEVAEQADEAIISMVRDYAKMLFIFREDGLLSTRPKNKTIKIIVHFNLKQSMIRRKIEEESDLRLISPAVSASASGAQAGTLSIMTAGSVIVVKYFKSYFDAIGSNTFYYSAEPGNSSSQIS